LASPHATAQDDCWERGEQVGRDAVGGGLIVALMPLATCAQRVV